MNDPQMTFDGLQARGCFGKTK